MKRNAKNIVLVVMVIVLLGLLVGCYCCPTCPQEQFEPQILGEIWHCAIEVPGMPKIPGMIDHMRDIAPCANYRWPAKEWYQLTSLVDTQKVINNIGTVVNLLDTFHNQPGCAELPFGYIKYLNGEEDYITAVIGNGNEIEFYKVFGPSGNLVKMYPDCRITEIVLY